MKQLWIAMFICASFFNYVNAQEVTTDQGELINWTSTDQNDKVFIQNGTGLPLVIYIHVDNTGAGIKVNNCGNTNHVDPGSTAICTTNDRDNFVNFSSDRADKQATGNYKVKERDTPFYY